MKSSTAPPLKGSARAAKWVPLWRIIGRIASAIGDSREPEHYAKTRLYIRQAALDGRLRIRGRHEIEIAGQDGTKFSDVYTEIPQAYWKHSVINALATGATFEADRHTNPETVYAWGQKGLHETNCYSGLQLNSDDVSQLIGDLSGIGFSADTAMSEKEEWISAASALSLLGIEYWLGTSTICKRAHAGLIQARAERFIHDERVFDNVDIPSEFWWAEGEAPLKQNWTTGDFDTWVGRGIDAIHLQAFGVTFRRSDIEKSKPRPLVVENAAFPAVSLSIEDINSRAASKIMEVVGTPEEASRSAEAEPDDLGTVFISYTHEGPDHAQAVLDLSKSLRDEGIDCVLDRYEASPPEGWPQWMDREIKKAQFVLMICTEAYYNRVMGKEKPGIGLGIAWEGHLIYNHIYRSASRNTKFLPVIFDEAHEQYIPAPTQSATRYCLSRPDGYEQLYKRLIGKAPTEKPPLGKLKALPQRKVRTTFLGASNEHEREVDALTKVTQNLSNKKAVAALDQVNSRLRPLHLNKEGRGKFSANGNRPGQYPSRPRAKIH